MDYCVDGGSGLGREIRVKDGVTNFYDTSQPELKVKYHRDKYNIFNYEIEKHGNFVDLATAEVVNLIKGEFTLISLGVSIKLPKGYWGQLVPRSSTFKKYGIIMANSFGVIDTDYCGEEDIWKFPAFATRDILIPANERICQFRIVKDNEFTIKEVDKMEDSSRGGFGSSDKKERKVTIDNILNTVLNRDEINDIDHTIKFYEKKIEDMYSSIRAQDGLPGLYYDQSVVDDCKEAINYYKKLIRWFEELKEYKMKDVIK